MIHIFHFTVRPRIADISKRETSQI